MWLGKRRSCAATPTPRSRAAMLRSSKACFGSGGKTIVSFEPRAVVASYEDGRFHIETSTQVPWSVRNVTARLLNVPASQIRVTVPAVGGGFGLKFDCALEPFAALLARAAERPVRLVNSRQEEMLTCLCRENAEIRIRSAVTREGEIVGREAVVLMDCGAYGGEQIFLTTMTAHTLGGNYRLGAVRLASRAIYTNTAPNGAFRACNGVYNTFALERHTDEICAAIGIDPLAFRRRNVLGDGDFGSTGQVFEGDVLGPMLDRMAELRTAKPSKRPMAGPRLYGRATTVGTWFVFVGPSAATINLNADGSATLVTSGVEIGSGTMMQALPQIVANALGLRPEDVIVRTADTDAGGLRCRRRRRENHGLARRREHGGLRGSPPQALGSCRGDAGVAPDDLVLADGRVEIIGIKGSGATIAEVAQRAQRVVGPMSGSGSFTRPGVVAMPGCATGHFIDAIDIPVFAVHECEVAVDPETGHVEVLSYAVVQDVGRAFNPRAIYSQIQGGVVQGLGYALHEEISIGANGRVNQTGFETYRVRWRRTSCPWRSASYEGAPSIGPLGTKGAGEVPILNVAAAVACAVSNATGRPVQEIPLTPPHVLALLLGNKPALKLPHISASWRDNVLAEPSCVARGP